MKFLISAGEASGESYGAQLIAALQARAPELEFFGVGGPTMRMVGCNTVVDACEIAVLGLFEVISHLPRIRRAFNQLLREIDRRKPDAAVLIDFPDFNFRLAKELQRRGIPIFYYVSPQLWAWRSGRIQLVRRYIRKMLVIFPFEQDWYARRGVDASYVGHPLADLPLPENSRADFAQKHQIDPARIWIALLPGSRRKEVALNLPTLLAAAERMRGGYQFLLPVASTLDASWVAALAGNGRVPVALTSDARATLFHAQAAAIASGTATVEAALVGTPFVMVYRVSPLTWSLGRHLVRVPFYGMVNLIAGREIVPELVQENFTPGRLAGELGAILADGPRRQQMLSDLASVKRALQPSSGNASSASRAAEIILNAVGPSATASSKTSGRQS